MTRLVQIAWLLPSLTLIGIAARDAIADIADRKQRQGRSWCLDCADGLRCDCPISGRL